MTAFSRRRRFVLLLALAVLFGADPVIADTSARLKRVVFVGVGDQKLGAEQRGKVIKAFAEEGFVNGRDIGLEFVEGIREGEPWPPESEQRAREIVATRPAVIMAAGDKIHIFRKVTKEIPLVFYYLGRDPVEWGLVESYRYPGGNVTGAGFPRGEDTFKVMELLKELRPGAKRAGTLVWEDELTNTTSVKYREWQRAAASRLGLEFVEIVVPMVADFTVREQAILRARIDLYCGAVSTRQGRDMLVRERIPFTGGNIHDGALVESYASWDENLANAIAIAAQVLRGANPANIPVRFPTRYYTKINLKTAREMGLAIPPSVRMKADELIDE